MRRTIRLLTLGLLLIALPATTLARRSDARARAAVHFEAAQAALDQKRFDDAIVEFTAAMAILPSPKLVYGIALANERKGDRGAARAFYRRAIADPKAGAELKAAAHAALKRLDQPVVEPTPPPPVVEKPETGTLILSANTPNARLSLDGVLVGPVEGDPLPVPPGRHRLVISAPGFEPSVLTVDVDAGQTRMLATVLTPLPDRGPDASTLRNWGWASVGIGAATLVSGVTLTLVADDKEEKLLDAAELGTVRPDSKRAVNRYIDSLDSASYGMYALTGAAAVAATTLFVLAERAPDTRGTVTPLVSAAPGGVVLGAMARF